jgi:hypothetical protein
MTQQITLSGIGRCEFSNVKLKEQANLFLLQRMWIWVSGNTSKANT